VKIGALIEQDKQLRAAGSMLEEQGQRLIQSACRIVRSNND
jgi:hypothetical protein